MPIIITPRTMRLLLEDEFVVALVGMIGDSNVD